MTLAYDLSYFPPAPTIEIELAAPQASFQVGPVRALVDTGADISLLPLRYIHPLQIQIDDRKYLRSQWGERRIVDVYFVDVGIGDVRLPSVEVIADEVGNELILGRNVPNQMVIKLDGPKRVLDVTG
jgi:hypothetical protein